MDGNGRWAKERGLIRTQGHLEGLKAAKRIVKAASDAGIKYLSLYVFSTENWKRTVDEVGFIMGLVKKHLRGEFAFYKENRIRIRHAGNSAGLPPAIAADLQSAIAETASFEGLQVILVLNYGGRDEIIRALNRYLLDKSAEPQAFELKEEDFRHFLDNPDIPDPDLIIRTAGEFRTSNFLLWEGAYSEYYISPKWWPDFSESDFYGALADFQKRERRYGGIKNEKTV
ncbi:polyprenyl diphosphate synthase [Breznakiellaceae bacterium SP9]